MKESTILIVSAAVIALHLSLSYIRVETGDPQTVWFFCDTLGICAKAQ